MRDFGVFSADRGIPPHPDAFDLPLFPFILSSLLRLLPDIPTAMRVASALNAVFFTAACAGLFGLARLLSGGTALAIFTVALYAAFPETWPYSLFHMPDSMFVFVFLWSILLLAAFFKTGRLEMLVSAFGLLALSTLIKPASLFFGFVFAFWCLLFWPRKEAVWRRFAWISCGFVLQAAVFSPWLARNQTDFGHPVLTTITGINYFRENYRMLLEDTRPNEAKAVLEAQEEAARLKAGAAWSNPVDQANLLGQIASRELKANFGSYFKTVAKRHPRLYLGTGSVALLRLLGDDADTAALEQWQSHPSLAGARDIPAKVIVLQLAAWGILCLAYLAALAGTVALLRRKDWLPLAVNVLPLLYFAAAVGPMTYTRYRMPMAPFFAMLASYGVLWVWEARVKHP